MAKKKNKPAGLMMTAKVVDIKRHDDGMSVVYFQTVDEELDIGDLVTVTIVRSEG